MNPEFRRNLWLELSTHRLIALPVIVGMVLWLSYLTKTADVMLTITNGALFFLLVIWGSRMSANTLTEEIEGRTWETQRLMPISAWQMTLGKLFGSTIYAWYGCAWCVAFNVAIALVFKVDLSYLALLNLILLGALTQALAFYFSLLQHRLTPEQKRFKLFFSQFSALLIAFLMLTWVSIIPTTSSAGFVAGGGIAWYKYTFPIQNFMCVSLLSFLAWAVVGASRLLSSELQCKPTPWVWPLFVIYVVAYVLGFAFQLEEKFQKISSFIHLADYLMYAAIAYFLVLGLTFLAAFSEPKNIITLRKWLHEARLGRATSAFVFTPGWLISLVFAILLWVLTLVLIQAGEFPVREMNVELRLSLAMTGLLLFLLRDIGLVYYLTISPRSTRGHASSVIYLMLLYTVVPALVAFIPGGKTYFLSALVPFYVHQDSAGLGLGMALLVAQVIMIWSLVAGRWQNLQTENTDNTANDELLAKPID